MPSDSMLARYALAYAAAGHAVLPLYWPTRGGCSCPVPSCPSVGKHPLTVHGKDDATDDSAQVLDWWTHWPRANIGIRPAPGLVVLDVDPRHGGDLSWAAITAAHDMPTTWTAATGGGGWHYWFAMSGPVRSALRPGIDLKGPNGYVVAPPSQHATGIPYRWATELPIARAPDWLAGMLRRETRTPIRASWAPQHRGGADGPLVRYVRASLPGSRNNRLFWALCRAAEGSADEAQIHEIATAGIEIGLPASEVEGTVRSALRTYGWKICAA